MKGVVFLWALLVVIVVVVVGCRFVRYCFSRREE